MRYITVVLFCFVSMSLRAASDYPVQPVPFTSVRLTGGLLATRQATNNAVTMPFALEQCESSGRIKNFHLAAEVMRRRAAGETNFQIKPPTQYPFDDSDVYKAIESSAFCLNVKPDAAVQAKLEAIIARISAAQESDGYLYTFRTMHPDSPGHDWVDQQRWLKDPKLIHELYNGVLSGVSLSGDRFFYPNPLEYDGCTKNNHGFAGRAPWFGCACCPPNVLRTLASLGDYVYAVQGEKLFVNLYSQGEATAIVASNKVKFEQTTEYPWDGKIKLRVTPEKSLTFTLNLRIPGWVEGKPLPSDLYTYDDATPAKWTLRVNGK